MSNSNSSFDRKCKYAVSFLSMVGDFVWFCTVTLLTLIMYVVVIALIVVVLMTAPFWGCVIVLAAFWYDITKVKRG